MNQPDWGTLLFGLVFCAVPLRILWAVFRADRKSKDMQQWPSTVGTITESAVSGDFQSFGGKSMWIEEPHLSYSYRVGGNEYTGHNISIAEMDSASKQDAQAKIEPYPVGKQVPIYYDPNDPEVAYLERQSGGTALALAGIVSVIFFVIGIVVIVYAIKH